MFASCTTGTINLRDWIKNTKALARLADPKLFSKARVGEHGASVVFIDDELDLGADNLRNLEAEQSGGIGHERMIEWMLRNDLTQQRAADAIGISRRMLNYYLSAEKPIPKTVWLACIGWEGSQTKRGHTGKRSAVMA
ncbi:MAG: helix-turn-helix transcriptional regulator [Proteobacteria bacterium]|nr:helix-turn-helix transcriptional regulator [Pseudomonadota bacterium]